MAQLEDVIAQLKDNDRSQQETTKLLRDFIVKQQRGKPDRLEDRIESKMGSAPPGGNNLGVFAQVRKDTQTLGIPTLAPLAIAFGAWMMDLDHYLRALRPDVLLKPVIKFFNLTRGAFNRFISIANELKKIRLPTILIEFPKVQFIDTAGKAITNFIDIAFKTPAVRFLGLVDGFIDIAFKTPAVRFLGLVDGFIDIAFKKPTVRFIGAVGDFIDIAFKTPTIRFVNAAGAAIKNLDALVPTPVLSFFSRITGMFDSIKIFDSTLPKVMSVPDGVKSFFTKTSDFFKSIKTFFTSIEAAIDLGPFLDPIKRALGFAGEGPGGSISAGLVGMFDKLKGFFGIIGKPVAFVTRILAGPFVQGFISLLDFIKGFRDAFGEKEDEFGNKLTFAQRTIAGLEGGVLGVVTGIVKALETLFLDLPGWLLTQLGFEKVGKFLKELNISEMVDPIWKWVKSVPQMLVDLLPSGQQIKSFIINQIAKLPGGTTILEAMGADVSYIKLARATEALAAAKPDLLAKLANFEANIIAADNILQTTPEYDQEYKTAARSKQGAITGLAVLRRQLRELETELAAAQAVVSTQIQQDNSQNNTNTFALPGGSALDDQQSLRNGLLVQ